MVIFVVEDGSGKSDATSYVTEAQFKQYHSNLPGRDTSALSDTEIQQYLNYASQLIDNNYRREFPGYRQYDDQALEWPRIGAYYIKGEKIDDSSVPVEIRNAVCEMAWVAYRGTDPEPILDGSTSGLKKYEVKVDVIEEKKEWNGSGGISIPVIPAVNNALSRITGGASSRMRLYPYRV